MKHIVVIGGVAAGLKAASKVRRCDPKAQITVIEKGDLISYGACGMPYYLSGEVSDMSHLMMTPAGAMRNSNFFKTVKNVNVLINTLASNINRTSKSVTLKNLKTGEASEIFYDKLVIATGASPITPPLPGVDLANIYQLQHPKDAEAIRNFVDTNHPTHAVIIGAGLIGMETAEALTLKGIHVTVIEMKNQVFPAFLDEEVAESVKKYLTGRGVQVLTDDKVVRFNGEESVNKVITENRSLPADLVILAIGVRPNIELAKTAGLVIGPSGAIAVNEYLETSDPDIYAGGDCVENTNIISGKKVFAPMGSTANKHGRIIGENICGAKTRFKGVLNTVAVKLFGLNVGKTGLTEREAKDLGYEYISTIVAGHDKPHYMRNAKPISLKLIVEVKTRKLLGAQGFGEGEVTKRIDVIAALLTMGGTIDDLFDIDLSYAPPFSSPIDNAAVAANVIMNKLEGNFKGISSFLTKQKMESENCVFLDVRSPDEFKQIRLANCRGVKNIPLGQLRTRFSELSKDDEIITFCKISLRGYEAALILQGEGYNNVKVMEGGIIAWPFACETLQEQ